MPVAGAIACVGGKMDEVDVVDGSARIVGALDVVAGTPVSVGFGDGVLSCVIGLFIGEAALRCFLRVGSFSCMGRDADDCLLLIAMRCCANIAVVPLRRI